MSTEQSIYAEYIQLLSTYQSKYGRKTIVLLQVGAFFEVYGFRTMTSNELRDTTIEEFSRACNLNVSEKKIVYDGCQVLMAGFRDYTLDRYLQKLTESGYTAVVYVQSKVGKTITRVLDSVHSPGTYISYEADTMPQMTNHIASIWIDIHSSKTRQSVSARPTMVYGIAVVNIFTGTSYIAEYTHSLSFQPTTFDDIERMMAIYCPSEVILLSTLTDVQINKVLQYGGIQTTNVHRVHTNVQEKAIHCTKQKYIQQVLATLYGEEAADQCAEFTMYPTATQAFCYLLDFMQEHNPKLVRNIRIPLFQVLSRTLLANHTLRQLNILDDGQAEHLESRRQGQLSSVSTFLNRCCTPMGRRQFHQQLVAPTTDASWLQKEYDQTAILLRPDQYPLVPFLRKQLGSLRDVEKLARQVVLRKLYPSSLFHLYDAIQKTQELYGSLAELPDVQAYVLAKTTRQNCIESMPTITQFLDQVLYIDRCATNASMQTFVQSILRPGRSHELDALTEKHDQHMNILQSWYAYLNSLMQSQEKGGHTATEYVKIHETEKTGMSLQITKKRGLVLKKLFQTMPPSIIPGTDTMVDWKLVKFSSASSTTDEIDYPSLDQTCRAILHEKERIQYWNATLYVQVLDEFEARFYPLLEDIAIVLAAIDVLQSKAYIAHEYKYCKPTLQMSAPTAFVQAEGLRHVLIEHLQTNEIYVANDITLGGAPTEEGGSTYSGMVLYGTNAVGKTSLIRALGIAIIMAQAGLYVPCTSFTLKPYTAIFSRIVGNDNLFRGLSTFAVEMSELRVILKMADEHSLILGDELCSGTETESALSIFVAGLMELHSKRSTFVFATHFHEIVKYKEIQALDRLTMQHMAVRYDRELDTLIYDRKLQPGPGDRMYGLEVCKSLHIDPEFLDKAYRIRATYFPDVQCSLSLNSSTYNSSKLQGGICELCKSEVGTEIHHLVHQALADQDGFIISSTKEVFHKNHPANLITLCNACHNAQHHTSDANEIVVSKKKTTRGKYIMQPNKPIK